MLCCLTADEDTLRECADQIDCEACPIREAREGLTLWAARSLAAFDLLGRRVVMDFHLSPLVFEALGLRLTRADIRGLVEALDLIYDIRYPVKRETHGR